MVHIRTREQPGHVHPPAAGRAGPGTSGLRTIICPVWRAPRPVSASFASSTTSTPDWHSARRATATRPIATSARRSMRSPTAPGVTRVAGSGFAPRLVCSGISPTSTAASPPDGRARRRLRRIRLLVQDVRGLVNPAAPSVLLGSASIANPTSRLRPAGIPPHDNLFNSSIDQSARLQHRRRRRAQRAVVVQARGQSGLDLDRHLQQRRASGPADITTTG